MNLKAIFVAASASCFLFACSGGSGAEKEENTEMTEQPAQTEEAPKEEAKDSSPGLADCGGGAVPEGATNCRLDLGTGVDTYWSDSTGVDPGTPACHYEFTDNTCSTLKPGRTFGELCLDDDRLVESNPGAGECHTHAGDVGGPNVFSCSAWCAEQGKETGKCVSGIAATGEYGDCQSAKCECG